MRVAFITPEFITEAKSFDGGLSNYLARVSIGLREAGHEATIFVAADEAGFVDWEGTPVYRVKAGPSRFRGWLRKIMHLTGDCMSLFWLQASHRLNEALSVSHNVEPFDIVQYSSYGATAYFRVRRIPAVVRLSNYPTLQRKAMGVACPTRDELRRETFERRAMCKGDRIFGPSRLTVDAVRKDTRRRVDLIPTPFVLETREFDTGFFQSHLHGKKYLLFFGSLWKLKGVPLILEILAELLQSNPGLSFVFVGKDLGAGSAIKAMQQNHADRILYFDRLPHSRLYPIVREAFAVVLPSLFDNCPNACIEAMAFGRPVIGSENAGFEELIDHGKTGFLCRRGNAPDLLRVLNEVLRLPPHIRAAVGEAGFKRVWELRPQRAIPKLISLYEDVLHSRRPENHFMRAESCLKARHPAARVIV